MDVPKLGPGDVLVRVRAALTCGTDVKVFRRGYHARMIQPPALFGHELAGDIVGDGRAMSRASSIGQRVVAANSAPCGECYYCQRGQENLCDDLLFNNGAYAEYIRIPERIVAKEHASRFRRTSAIRTPRWWSRWPACCAAWKRAACARATPWR